MERSCQGGRIDCPGLDDSQNLVPRLFPEFPERDLVVGRRDPLSGGGHCATKAKRNESRPHRLFFPQIESLKRCLRW